MRPEHLRLTILAALSLAACADPEGASDSPAAKGAGAGAEAGSAPGAEAGGLTAAEQGRAELRPEQAALLDAAFDAASGFPTVPHLKNRARAKESVVMASLALDQPERALRYADSIHNWRRGLGHAEIAFWAAVHGDGVLQESSLAVAQEVAGWSAEQLGQEWRREEVLSRVAAVAQWDAHPAEAAAALAAGHAPRNASLDEVYALLLKPEECSTVVDGVEQAIVAGSLDQVMSAIRRSVAVYRIFGADEAVRAEVLAAVDEAEGKVPLAFFLDVLLQLGEADAARGDREDARARLERAHALVEQQTWLPRDLVPVRARVASLRIRAGQEDQARAELDAAREFYATERERIADIRRTTALVPLAQAYALLGEREAALQLYARAVEEAQVNPNSRPRAEDLVLICRSLLEKDVRPDEELLAAIRAAVDGLGAPW